MKNNVLAAINKNEIYGDYAMNTSRFLGQVEDTKVYKYLTITYSLITGSTAKLPTLSQTEGQG